MTYAEKLTTADRELRWDQPAERADRQVRVGGAWTTFRGKRLRVIAAEPVADAPGVPTGAMHGDVAACGDGGLRLLVVQPEGRAPMPYWSWANGARPTPSERLGAPA
jgi:methionyl-tRNA formyltransferase